MIVKTLARGTRGLLLIVFVLLAAHVGLPASAMLVPAFDPIKGVYIENGELVLVRALSGLQRNPPETWPGS